jgi:hypothetical protein
MPMLKVWKQRWSGNQDSQDNDQENLSNGGSDAVASHLNDAAAVLPAPELSLNSVLASSSKKREPPSPDHELPNKQSKISDPSREMVLSFIRPVDSSEIGEVRDRALQENRQ